MHTLDLYHNNVGDVGATVLASVLETNKSVWNLDLAANGITLEGVNALCNVVVKHNAMKRLVLSHNLGAIPRNLLSAVHKRMNYYHVLVAVRSANACRRVGINSFARLLPNELCRMLKSFLAPVGPTGTN